MKVKPITFTGRCASCQTDGDDRGGVDIGVGDASDSEYIGEWLCLRCARQLAERLVAATDKCTDKMLRGLRQRGDRWVRPKPKASAA